MECLNGIRVLSMCWVILGHTYVVAEFVYLRNPMKITDVSTKKKVSTFVTSQSGGLVSPKGVVEGCGRETLKIPTSVT